MRLVDLLSLGALLALAVGCDPEPDSKVDDTGPEPSLDADGDGYDAGDDCDDADPDVHPGAIELCNGIDDDCDAEVDEDASDVSTWYADLDGDGFGDPEVAVSACEQASGYVGNGDDCDDGDAAVNPDATELCNGIDDDCDGLVDDEDDIPADASTWYLDGDADGYGLDDSVLEACEQPSGYAAVGGDCDDGDPAFNPAADEDDCTDPNDYNCDGSVGYADEDGDGYAACVECDDGDAAVNPGATELCNGIDDDCDLDVDEDDAADAGTWYADTDADGYGDGASSYAACDAPRGYVADATDCDDGDAAVNPAATELCNGVDDDCDGTVDEDDAADASTWYADSDADGYGDAASVTVSCEAPSGHVADDSDCDDGDVAVNPAATEVCNGVDDDCDGAGDPMDGSGAICPAADCLDVASYAPGVDGWYWIDPGSSGSAYEVYCEQSTEGGGWTLIMVASDDGQDTWTWDERELMSVDTTLVGDVAVLNEDMKSQAYHDLLFADLLFVHAPSGVTAAYEGVGDATMDLGSFIDAVPYPNCDLSLAGNGYAQTGGSLSVTGNLCDTDLYFNLGDHESGESTCADFTSSWNHATYGPVWSAGFNNGCPFDDPSSAGLGPSNADCSSCSSTDGATEIGGLGFGSAAGLNTGAGDAGENYLWVLVR
jgi:hypothetical protein